MPLVTLNGSQVLHGTTCPCSACSSHELGKFSFPKIKMKIRAPKFPRFKAPKLKFKAPKIKLKIKGPNFSKMGKSLMAPFEQISRSATGLASGLLDQVGATAGQLVNDVGQAAGQMAPELLQAGANLLAPGAGSLLDMVPGLANITGGLTTRDQSAPEDMPTSRQMLPTDYPSIPQYTPQADQQAQPANDENALMKYAPYAIGAAALIYFMSQGKGKR